MGGGRSYLAAPVYPGKANKDQHAELIRSGDIEQREKTGLDKFPPIANHWKNVHAHERFT